ncbi:hypothetical protein PG991_001531 [Apiospora marii]|uniref:Uncharacterized protein n=1 Tax=Apiospora marii TaxID=335849 RepID=A0ABR1SRQ5_9PEZI
MTHPESRPIGFLFINTAHPSEASTPRSLSRIRSHASKENRARAARIRPGSERAQHGARRCGQAINNPNTASRSRGQKAEEIERRQPAPESQIVHIPSLCGPDPQWSPARSLSAQETSLLDHYVNHVILFNRGRCHAAGDSAPPWFTSMQLKCWLPFALADPGLLAALLLQACRSLEGSSSSSSSIGHRPRSYYADTYLAYKQQCIRWVNRCVTSEHERATDATIAMVMVLLTESYLLGNLEEWQVHLSAHARMLELRGGIDTLGLDGFLKGVIEKSPWLFQQSDLPVDQNRGLA